MHTAHPPPRERLAAPVHTSGPEGPWQLVRENLARHGNAAVYATWGEWLPAVLTEPALRPLLGRDFPRYRQTADATARYRFVASRLVVKYTAAAALGTSPAALDLAYKAGGRPYLRGFGQIDLSLSHTDELVAVAVSRTGRIGVDAEPAGRRLSFDLLRGQVCTPAEQEALLALPEEERTAGLLRLWTLKEAYTKALGLGMRLDFSAFGFGTLPEGPGDGYACGDAARLGGTGLLAPDGRPAAHGEWAFATYPVLGRYLVSVAGHDAGLDPSRDTAVATMLDEGFTTAVSAMLDQAFPPGASGTPFSGGLPARP